MANYSSADQLRENVPLITVAVMADAAVVLIMDKTDDIVENDVGMMIDFDLVTAADELTTPSVVNLLSQYKTAERCLVAKYSARRMDVEQTDYVYWQYQYDQLVAKVIAGEVDLGAFAGTTDFTNKKADVRPALGMGENGEALTEAERDTWRAKYGGSEIL